VGVPVELFADSGEEEAPLREVREASEEMPGAIEGFTSHASVPALHPFR
jgi:hypothetical protein